MPRTVCAATLSLKLIALFAVVLMGGCPSEIRSEGEAILDVSADGKTVLLYESFYRHNGEPGTPAGSLNWFDHAIIHIEENGVARPLLLAPSESFDLSDVANVAVESRRVLHTDYPDTGRYEIRNFVTDERIAIDIGGFIDLGTEVVRYALLSENGIVAIFGTASRNAEAPLLRVYRFDAATGDVALLPLPEELAAACYSNLAIAVSSDGGRIVVHATGGDRCDGPVAERVFVFDAETATIREIDFTAALPATPPQPADSSPLLLWLDDVLLSGDGKTLVADGGMVSSSFHSVAHPLIVDLDDESVALVSGAGFGVDAALSSNGRYVVYAEGAAYGAEDQSTRIIVRDLSSGEVATVRPEDTIARVDRLGRLWISDDGQLISFYVDDAASYAGIIGYPAGAYRSWQLDRATGLLRRIPAE